MCSVACWCVWICVVSSGLVISVLGFIMVLLIDCKRFVS